MANVIHRRTLEHRPSVNTPDFRPEDWIINPDLSALEGVPRKYWTVDGDRVLEMTTSQKAAVDAAAFAVYKVAKLERLRDKVLEKTAVQNADYQNAIVAVEAAKTEAEVDAVEL